MAKTKAETYVTVRFHGTIAKRKKHPTIEGTTQYQWTLNSWAFTCNVRRLYPGSRDWTWVLHSATRTNVASGSAETRKRALAMAVGCSAGVASVVETSG